MINKDILRQALKMIEDNPLHWDQSYLHCGTSHCFFGMVDLIELKLHFNTGDKEVQADAIKKNVSLPRHETGLSNDLFEYMSYWENTLDDLRFYVKVVTSNLPMFLINFICYIKRQFIIRRRK